MAKISVQCPSCSTRGSVDEALAGKKIRCPKCGTKFAAGSGAHADLQPIASAAATKTIAFPCPRCKKQITIRADRAGSRIDCPGCSTPVSVPVPRGLRPASQAESPPRSPIPEQPHHREAVSHEPALAASSVKLAASHEETKPEPSSSTEEDSVPVDWKPGDVILDLYEVTGVLGEGGMGKVFKVHHRGWNTDLAVKSPRPEIQTRPGAIENFERECETWVNLGLHPHIVSCHYVRRLGGSARVFAEYVAGGSLQDWIHGQDGQPAKLYEGGPQAALERMLDIAIQFAWGLHYAHEQGLIHQDVKPANVMMTPDGTAKVTDFGLAKARAAAGEAEQPRSEPGSTRDRRSILVSVGGMTPAYCSPEQASRQPLSRKTDIWSWAASVLEMFTGEVTWPSGSVAGEALEAYLEVGAGDERIPSMPTGVADLLRRCFQRQSEARPDGMQVIADTLKQIYQAAVGQDYTRPEPVAAELLADGLNNRALSLLDLDKAAEAERVWEEGLRHDVHHLEATYNLGLVRFRGGRLPEEALLHQLQEVCSSHPDQWQDEFLLAQACVFLGQAERATKLAEELEQTGQREAIEASRRLRQQLAGSGRCLRTFEGHAWGVTSVCLSGDGRYALSGSVDHTLRLWELDTGRCLRTFEGHSYGVNSVCLSVDGRFALSGSDDNTLRLWEVGTGRCLRTFEGHTSWVNSVCLSGDGCYALSGSGDNTLRLWELGTGRCLRTFEGHPMMVGSVCVCLSGDGRYALSGSGDDTVRLWELGTGRCLRIFEGYKNPVCLTCDGRYALSASTDRTLRLWELGTGRSLRTFEGHTEGGDVGLSERRRALCPVGEL